MGMTYQNVLDRLKEERLRQHWSQAQISEQMRMSQSHYSKAELGNRRFTYYEVQYLCQLPLDVHFIFTGFRSKSENSKMFSECNYEELICNLNILASIAECFYKNKLSKKWESVYKRTAYLRYLSAAYESNHSILYTIRILQGHTQREMADVLGVDVKKFRDMENGRTLPNSEILWMIYKVFHVPPAVMVKDNKGLISEICCIQEKFSDEQNSDVFQCVKAVYSI